MVDFNVDLKGKNILVTGVAGFIALTSPNFV